MSTLEGAYQSEFRAAFVRTSFSLRKPRPYPLSEAREAIRGTDMSFSSFGTNPIAPRFLAVHFFVKKIHFFYKPRKSCGFYNHSIGEVQPM